MGSADSTFLGTGEIKHAAAAMKNGASTELRFEESSVLFRMEMNLHEATPPQIDSALPPLPAGMRLICAGMPEFAHAWTLLHDVLAVIIENAWAVALYV